MNQLLPYLVLITLFGLLFSIIVPRKKENTIFWISISTIAIHLVGALVLAINWLMNGAKALSIEGITIYHNDNFTFAFEWFYDNLTMVYILVADIVAFAVLIFSRYYMHRDWGFKRFFNNILFFFLGLNIVIFSGNFELLFTGWEILGISSFLLIGFYRDRYLPVKNALKVVSLYRLSDIFLLSGIWLCHHYFGHEFSFKVMQTSQDIIHTLQDSFGFYWLIPLLFVIVGAIKSAQLPFSSWLPRAMEGPTTSSAIFYGSLSVHIGLFLLLRISPLWMDVWSIRIVIIVLGISTSFVGNYIARVQSSIKTQIAYSSIAQIGLMFVETGLGLHTLVLFHFAGNAFLRTYQLLVSPSVLNYLIHDQYFHFEKPKDKNYSGFLGKIRTSIFLLSIKEWNLDTFQFRFLWSPFKTIGKSLQFLRHKLFYIIIGLFFLFGLSEVVSGFKLVQNNHESFVIVYALVGVVLILLAFTERAAAKRAWIFLVSSQLYFALAIAFNEQFELSQVLIYLSGDIVCAIVGYLCLNRIEKTEGKADLGQFYGHIYEHPRLGTAFLLSCLGLVGFPITPAFIGVDLLISHIHTDQLFLILIVAIGFIFMEIAALRMYSRIFLGQHVKQYHEIAFRNS